MNFLVIFAVVALFGVSQGFRVYFHNQDDVYDDQESDNEMVRGVTERQSFQMIVPGTKWCGSANISEDNWSLGTAVATDYCCREHDFCEDTMDGFSTKHNLTNKAFYTKLLCKCDLKFYECLKGSGVQLSNSVGKIYFNVLGTQCFNLDYPIAGCGRYHDMFKTRCTSYIFDTSKEKKWQWFDVPLY